MWRRDQKNPQLKCPKIYPSVRLYTYANQADFLDNYQQFYMDLTQANTESEITWQMLYDFKKTYKVPDLSVKSVTSVLNGMIASDESLRTFLQLNTVNRVNGPCEYKWASSVMFFMAEGWWSQPHRELLRGLVSRNLLKFPMRF